MIRWHLRDPAFGVLGAIGSRGVKDLAFLTTKAGHILARDARTGATVWSAQNGGISPYTTSSPAIAPVVGGILPPVRCVQGLFLE